MRFGVRRLIVAGLVSAGVGYTLFLPVGLDSAYGAAILPTVIFGGFGFALAYGPLNIAATNGIAPEEQGLASGLVNTSFQFGGALVLAVATAVNNAANGAGDSPSALLDGFQAAVVVSVIASGLGVAATALRRRPRLVPAAEQAELAALDVEPETEAEAA
jgi:MFS family permease